MATEPAVSPRPLAQAIMRLGDSGLSAQDYAKANTQYSKPVKHQRWVGAIRGQLMGSPARFIPSLLDNLLFDNPALNNELHGTIFFDVTERVKIQGSDTYMVKKNIDAIAIKLD
jgi:hypothetical protein